MIKERIKKFLPDRLISKEKVNEIDIGVKQYYRTNMVAGWFIILGAHTVKQKFIVAITFAMLHYCVAVGADFLLSYDIRVPKLISGVCFLVLWGYLNYKLFSPEEPILQHVMYMSLPVVIMFALYIPLVRVLIINLPLIYVAPIFTIATSIVARFTLPITVWTVVAISSALIIIIAYIGAKMQHTNEGSKEIN